MRLNWARFLTCTLGLFFIWTMPLQAQQNEQSSDKLNSWYLEFDHEVPDVYIYENAAGERTRFLYVKYTIRNQLNRTVPLLLQMVLRTEDNKYFPATSYRNVEYEIIREELGLGKYALGLQKEKIRDLKQHGRYLSWPEVQMGYVLSDQFYNRKAGQVKWKTQDILPLVGKDGGEQGTYLRARDDNFPADEPRPEGVGQHPAKITGIVLFKDVGLETDRLELIVGGLLDPIKQIEGDASKLHPHTFEPQVLEIAYNWSGPPSTKVDQMPELVGRTFKQRQFGPIANADTLRSLIDILAHDPLENREEQKQGNASIRRSALEQLRTMTKQNFGYQPDQEPSANQKSVERWREWYYRNQHDLAYSPTPEHHFEVVKKPDPQSGGKQDEQALLRAMKTLWEKNDWTSFLLLFPPGERTHQNIESLFWNIGPESIIQSGTVDQDREDTRNVTLQLQKTADGREESDTYRVRFKKEHDRWYLIPENK